MLKYKQYMKQNSISISQFKQHDLHSVACYRDDILVTNHVEDIEPFRHPCRLDAITVIVCIGGKVDCSVNLKCYTIEKDTLLVIFTGDIIQIHNAEALEAYAVVMSSNYLYDLHIGFRLRSSFRMEIRRNAIAHVPYEEILLLKPYYDLLNTNIYSIRMEHQEILNGLVRAFSYTVISLMHAYQNQEKNIITIPRNQQLFDKFMTILTLHHTCERSVIFYADRMCLTSNYLSGAIKEYSGKSALEWINEYVITEAKMMLRSSGLSIQEIAYRLNFTSQSAFGKYFKQQTGISPKAYRKE